MRLGRHFIKVHLSQCTRASETDHTVYKFYVSDTLPSNQVLKEKMENIILSLSSYPGVLWEFCKWQKIFLLVYEKSVCFPSTLINVYQWCFSSSVWLGYFWYFPCHYWNIFQYFISTEPKFSIWNRGIIPHLCLLGLEMPF